MAEILPIRADHSRSNDAERNELTRSLLEEAAETTGTERQRLIDEVVLLNLRLAESIAKRYSGRGIERDDLVQVANVGLVNAAQRFDPGMGKDFYSYAVPTITGEVKRYFRDHGWTVRPPRRVQELHAALTSASADVAQTLGTTPTPGDLATTSTPTSPTSSKPPPHTAASPPPPSTTTVATATKHRWPTPPATTGRPRQAHPLPTLLQRLDPTRNRRRTRRHPNANLPTPHPQIRWRSDEGRPGARELLDNAVRHGSKGTLDEAKTDVKDAGEDAENALDR